ncbi:MAG: sulfide/dihydroorotate dehydrogenase-like FAD/NAD-binding protein [Ignavibacteriales bacterium]|nr:sulfide/dihydroorotate dehydrogenase-like FAD/NAD-binding protein [Ignavibacteriales bacterium]
MYRIVEKKILAPTITKFIIEALYVARKRKAGNFVIIRVEETGERIPLTLVDSNLHDGTITLIVQAIGKTTKALALKKEGDLIMDVMGPLGNPTPIETGKTIACIGGGVGTAELYPITKALKDAGNTIYTIVGARSKDLVILEKEMESVSDTLYITTDDGSYKRKGFVTDQLKELLDASLGINMVYAIGPLPMMRAVSNLTKPYSVRTLVSLNAVMVDGTGMCGGCRVTVNGKMKFACVDGPEFEGHEVDFDEMLLRNRSYTDMEKISVDRFLEEPHVCRKEGMAS